MNPPQAYGSSFFDGTYTHFLGSHPGRLKSQAADALKKRQMVCLVMRGQISFELYSKVESTFVRLVPSSDAVSSVSTSPVSGKVLTNRRTLQAA